MDHGLTEYQARVYLTLLDVGSATASQIAPLSKVPRTRIYTTMQQLHHKGLVQILPEAPLRYQPVPFEAYLRALAEDLRSRVKRIEEGQDALAREFAIVARVEPEARGRFEAIYGRKNVRERLVRMYTTATREVIGIGTTKSPGRILGAFRPNLVEKAAQGVRLRYAFCFAPENRDDVRTLLRHAEVRHIDFMMPVYMHVVDGKEFLMSHPIPDDDSSYRGDDIAVWTNDPAIAGAMSEMSERIWEMGRPAADLLEEPRTKRVAVTRP
jgi:HTH-type transcriptional regulator, sugar sensing transcriptional regulator